MPNQRSRYPQGLLDVTERDQVALGRWISPPSPAEPLSDADVPDFIRHTWRWNDLEALNYEYNQALAKMESAARATAINTAVGAGGLLGQVAQARRGRPSPPTLLASLARRGGIGVAVGAAGLGYLGERDYVQFGRRAAVLRERIAELRRR